MDSYQAIYDAVRSKISGGDVGQAIHSAIWDQNWSHYIEQAAHAIAADAAMPYVLMRPRLYLDGNRWCALYGDNLQDGVAGFGDSPAEAMTNFNASWWKKLPEKGAEP